MAMTCPAPISGADCSETVNYNTTLVLTATPTAGSTCSSTARMSALISSSVRSGCGL